MSENIAPIMELLTTCTNVRQLHIYVLSPSKKTSQKLTYLFFSVLVSDLNATDKTPMYEMPLITCLGLGASILSIWVLGNGILSLAFCPENEISQFSL